MVGWLSCRACVSQHGASSSAAVLSMLLVACSGAAPASRATPAVGVFALLVGNRLVRASSDGSLQTVAQLGPTSPVTSTGRFLARAGDTIYALSPGPPGSLTLAAVSVRTTRVERTLRPAAEAGVFYRGLAVGTRTGHLYLFGNRIRGPDRGPGPHGGLPLDAVVSVLDPATGTLLNTWTAREFEGASWFVWRGAISADEASVFLSYHGPDTTGIDRFEVTASGLVRCQGAKAANLGCFLTHGGFELYGDRLLALGTPTSALGEFDASGRELRDFDVKLPDNHLMELLLDAEHGAVYVPGSCLYVGGLSRLDLTAGSVKVLAPPRTGSLCGDRLALTARGQLVLAQGDRDQLLFVNADSGRQLSAVRVPAEVLDLVGLRL